MWTWLPPGSTKLWPAVNRVGVQDGSSPSFWVIDPDLTVMRLGPGWLCQPVLPPGAMTFETTKRSDAPCVAISTLCPSTFDFSRISSSEPTEMIDVVMPVPVVAMATPVVPNVTMMRATRNVASREWRRRNVRMSNLLAVRDRLKERGRPGPARGNVWKRGSVARFDPDRIDDRLDLRDQRCRSVLEPADVEDDPCAVDIEDGHLLTVPGLHVVRRAERQLPDAEART